jgi:hypothetical protein
MSIPSTNAAWVTHWQRVGPILEKIRYEELRAMSDSEAALAFRSLADFAESQPAQSPRLTSGFVEQQRLFMKLRRA